VASPALTGRSNRIHAARPHRIFPRQPALCQRTLQAPAPGRHCLGA
jgi:hypothetical protein